MELTGDLKKKVKEAASRDEAKKVIEDAGMLLTDEELDRVASGSTFPVPPEIIPPGRY